MKEKYVFDRAWHILDYVVRPSLVSKSILNRYYSTSTYYSTSELEEHFQVGKYTDTCDIV